MERDRGPPGIEFPCLYPIKVIGAAGEGFREAVAAAVERCAGALAPERISERPSRGGNYLAVTVTIDATGEPQLRAVFEELRRLEGVKMVL